ncbi:hypothetical protein [Halotia branconii]|uniref:Uncharacterized protein n=1 Tax=Halotia branconii CENA392 TaxID=1539056 RepID=A0AAJ6PAJ5_9CYAN|nr:hypothetical protein [Halotia branconii]WGV26846.1 hypothetical protein QI031_04915 [Halotia branconii CENA392]
MIPHRSIIVSGGLTNSYAVTQPPHVNVNEILIRPTEMTSVV